MKKSISFIILCCSMLFCLKLFGQFPIVKNPINKVGYKLVFNDEFDTGPFNDAVWLRENGYKSETQLQIYVDNLVHQPVASKSNYIFQDSCLNLTSWKTAPPTSMQNPQGRQYTSAWFESLLAFKYGYFEMNCKLPSGNALFPAFWLYTAGVGEVQSLEDCYQRGSHEIDIFEYWSNNTTVAQNNWLWMNTSALAETDCKGYSSSQVDSLWGFENHSCQLVNLSPTDVSFANGYHTFALEWGPTFMRFYLDNVPLRTIFNDCRISRTYMKIIANLAMESGKGTPPDPSQFSINYIRVYKKIANTGFSSQQWNNANSWRLVGDVNGDGKDDIVGLGKPQISVALANDGNNGPGFNALYSTVSGFSYPDWNVQRDDIYMTDIDNDGAKDIVGFGLNGVTIALAMKNNNPFRFTIPALAISQFGANQDWNKAYHRRMVGDINGDNIGDIVGFGWRDVIVAYGYKDSYGSFAGFKPYQSAIVNNEFCYGDGNSWKVDRDDIYLADVDNDGAKDIVGFGLNGVTVAYGIKQSNTLPPRFTAPVLIKSQFGTNQDWNKAYHRRMVGDVNGDGFGDIVGFGWRDVIVAYGYKDVNGTFGFREHHSVIINNGFCYGDGNSWDVVQHPIYLDDINGDGAKDIIGFYKDGVKVAYGDKKNNWETPSFTYINDNFYELNDYGCNSSLTPNGRLGGFSITNDIRLMADINGDGVKDIVAFGNDGVYVTPFTNCNHLTRISTLKNATLLSHEAENIKVDNYTKENNLLVYPNPSNGSFTIYLQNNQEQPSDINIFNNFGVKIYQSKLTGKQEFNLGGYPKGIYILNVRTIDSLITKKIVLE